MEFEQKHFMADGRDGVIIYLGKLESAKKYIWRMEFLGEFDEADRELLKNGFCLVYYNMSDQFGSPEIVESMRRFQDYIEKEFNLFPKAVLEGLSRGGLYAVNYAAKYPEKVSKIYLDAPVLDIFSWPAGLGRGDGSAEDWELCRKIYNVRDKNVPENPVNKIQTLIENKIPILLVMGDSDTVVPPEENGYILYAKYKYADAPIKMIVKPGAGHHPHGLGESHVIADWVRFDDEFGCIIENGPQDWQILQQDENGFAEVKLSGRCVNYSTNESFNAYIRVVNESDALPVVNWVKCDMDGNRWSAKLHIPRGGLYRIDTCMDTEYCHEWSRRGDCICHIGVGDVFVIAGQSNSVGFGKDFLSDLPEPGVHLMKNSGKWDMASHPMGDSTNTVHPHNMDCVNTGSSPYLSFGKYLKRELGYPIGFIQTALGGSRLEAWTAPDGYLYRAMIDTVKQFGKVKGVVWYQGCSDVDLCNAETYKSRFEKFVADVRAELNQPKLPFLTFQINRVTDGYTEAKDRGWGMIREAQRTAAHDIENVFVVSSWGGGLSDEIHNAAPANLMMGERLARSAMRHLYGRDIMCDSPDIVRAVKCGEKTIRLEFANVYDRLNWKSSTAKHDIFFMESNGVIRPVSDAKISGVNTVDLEFDEEIPEDCAVHGAYRSDLPYPPVMDTGSRLPMLSFYNVKVE